MDLPLIQSLSLTNKRHIEQAALNLEAYAGRRFGFLGLTFKPGTDDLRESPTLELMAILEGRGEVIRAYDPNLRFNDNLKGQIAYVRHACPQQANLMDGLEGMIEANVDDLLACSDVLVVSHATDEFRAAVQRRRSGVHVLDLARLFKDVPSDPTYHGIAW